MGHKGRGGALRNGMCVQMKETPKNFLPYEDRERRQPCLQPGREPSPDTEFASPIILTFLASRMVRSKCWLFVIQPSL